MAILLHKMMRLWIGPPKFHRWPSHIRISVKLMPTYPPELQRSTRLRMRLTTFWRFLILQMKWEFLFLRLSTCRWTIRLQRSLSTTRHTRPSSNTSTCDRNGCKLFETRIFCALYMSTQKTTLLISSQRSWASRTSLNFDQ